MMAKLKKKKSNLKTTKMTKTYLLEEAKELVKNGTHQIYNDCNSKLETLRHVTELPQSEGNYQYYSNNDKSNSPIYDLEIIPLSAIEDIKWGDEVQGSDTKGETWSVSTYFLVGKNPKSDGYLAVDKTGCSTHYRLIRKPIPNFSALMQSTQPSKT